MSTHHHAPSSRSSFVIPKWLPWLVAAVAVGYLVATLVAAKLFLSGVDSPKVRAVARWTPVPVAQVGGELIWAREYLEFKTFIETFVSRSAEAGQVISQETSVDEQTVQILVDNRIIAEAAAKDGIVVSEAEIDAAYREILVAQSDQPPREVTEAELQTILEELYGSDQDELRELIRIRLIENKVKTELLEQANIRQILVTSEQVANDLIGRIQAGEAFADRALEFSEHRETREIGGEIGFVARGEQLPPEVEAAVFTAEPGLVPEPVKTEFGYHVIEILEKRGRVQQSFEDWLATAREQHPSRVYLGRL